MKSIARLALLLALLVPFPALAGTITQTVVDDKGSVTIPNGHFEKVFGSRMSADLGPEWGDLAGHYERKNSEKLVWVNDGPPIVIHFANVFPKEIHVPQTPKPNPRGPTTFFDIFIELNPDGTISPLHGGMQIEEGPDTFLEGASGTKFFGKVTPINDLSLLPTSNANDTLIVWDLSKFTTTTGNFYLIEYELPPIELVPEPSALELFVIAVAGGLLVVWSRLRCAPTVAAFVLNRRTGPWVGDRRRP
jgi:hypothetical protein